MGPAIRGLCPLIQVFDMPNSLNFYRNILGFVEVQKSGPGEDQFEIVYDTVQTTRKAQNVRQNAHVSMLRRADL